MIEKINEIIKYKDLLINLTAKELKLKYKNSILGFLWSFLNPLMMLIVYTFAFKYVMKVQIPNFTVFLLCGILPWTFFQTSIIGSTHSIVVNAGLVKKVYFPREIIPLSSIFSNFINYLITMIVLFLAILIFKVKIGVAIFLMPLVLILMLLFTIGLSLGLAALNVLYRDVSHFVEIVFMAWFYFTPIVYSMSLIPERFRIFLLLNPMTLIIESLRDTLINNQLPKISYLVALIIIDIIFVLLGYRIFSRIEKSFAEEI